MSASVRAASLSNYVEVARQVRLDPRRTLREAGLDSRALTDPDTRIPVAAVAELLEKSAERSGCPTFGLRMAESRQLSDFGALSLLIKQQLTLRDVMATIARHRYILNEALITQIDDSGDLVIVREEFMLETTCTLRQSYELAVGTLFRMFRALLGARWQAISVNFVHAAPADLNIHRRLFGSRIEFDSEFNGFVCLAADVDRPNPVADPVLAKYAQQFIDTLPDSSREATTHEVRKAIYLLLPGGDASITRIAESLGLNVRTLQRRLDASGAEYSDLLNGVRKGLAVRYLENHNYSLTRVAQMLGYSQLSSFTRWFALQFGTSPTQWRNEQNTAETRKSQRKNSRRH